MSQTHNEHLTTGQLSASFDKQLSPQEQAVFDAHIATCQQCQNRLSDLCLTAALVHALPEEEVPRSFVLPGSISIASNQTIRQDAPFTSITRRHRAQRTVLRRSIRIVSTLAAVLALCFIISGILPLIYNGVSNSATSASSSSTFGKANTIQPTVTIPGVQQSNRAIPQNGSAATAPPAETTHSLSPSGPAKTPSSSEHSANPGQSPTPQPAMDLSQPVVRLGIGVFVLAISIIVLIVSRHRRVAVH